MMDGIGKEIDLRKRELELREAELALEFSKKATARRDFRRKVELQLAFGLWLFLTSAIVYLFTKDVPVSGGRLTAICAFVGILGSVVHFVLYSQWYKKSDKSDRSHSIIWENVSSRIGSLDSIFDEEKEKEEKKKGEKIDDKEVGYWASWGMIGITSVLGLLLITVSVVKQYESKSSMVIDFSKFPNKQIQIYKEEIENPKSNSNSSNHSKGDVKILINTSNQEVLEAIIGNLTLISGRLEKCCGDCQNEYCGICEYVENLKEVLEKSRHHKFEIE